MATKKAMSTTITRWIPYLYLGVLIVVAVSVVYFILTGAIGSREIGTAFLAMVGTFIGALFAFRLNESKDNIQLHKERRTSLYRAQLVVMRQHNAVQSLAKLLAPYSAEFERAFNCPAFQPPSYSDLTHDFDDLVFLLEVEPNVLMRLTVEQESFHQTMECLRTRNEFYVKEVQPAIANGSFNLREFTVQKFKAALGERLFGTATSGAERLYDFVGRSEVSLMAMHNELFDTAKKLYPDAKFVKLAPND